MSIIGGNDDITMGGTTIAVAAGSQATILGTDGTMIASNAFNGSTSINNIENWNSAGTVATGSFSRDWQLNGLSNGLSLEFTDYSGLNANVTRFYYIISLLNSPIYDRSCNC